MVADLVSLLMAMIRQKEDRHTFNPSSTVNTLNRGFKTKNVEVSKRP